MRYMTASLTSVTALLCAAPILQAAPMGTAFTYQGRLTDGGSPANGMYDFLVWVCDAAAGGNVLNSILYGNAEVQDGLFVLNLDCGYNVFTGSAIWLELGVRPVGSGEFTMLSPRQAVRPAPYALFSAAPWTTGAGGIISYLGGNVGIGVASPSSPLTVNGVIESKTGGFRFPDGTTQTTAGSGGGGLTLPYSGSGAVSYAAFDVTNNGTGYAIHGTAAGNSAIYGQTSSLNNNHAGIWGKSTGAGPGVAGTASGTNNHGVHGGGAGTGAGVYGISAVGGKGVFGEATATSGVNYGVYGRTASPAGWAGYFEGRSYFSTNVGIGTTSPGAMLHVVGDTVVQGQGWPGFASESRLLLGDGNHYIKSVAGYGVRMGTYGAPGGLVLQETTGNVGIGTTDPEAKLHVLGPGRFDFPTGSVNISTPGGNPGLISFASNGHRRDVVFDDDGMRLMVSDSGGPASKGIDIFEDGRVKVQVLEIAGGSDLAEPFDVHGDQPEPGMVVVIDPEHPGQLKIADQAYDKRVAGVISGAGGINVGMVLSQPGALTDGNQKVALTGRVYVMADASYGPIEPGDLLTSSATRGHAMKASDRVQSFGTVVGKAMQPLKQGRGLVLALVNLQ